MEDLKAHIDDVLDLKALIVEAVVREKQLMVDVFQQCGKKEFTFIRRSGFYFGTLFGLIQMGVFFVYNATSHLWFLGRMGHKLVSIKGYLSASGTLSHWTYNNTRSIL
eukprot:788604_1